jgi:hypothetical protein
MPIKSVFSFSSKLAGTLSFAVLLLCSRGALAFDTYGGGGVYIGASFGGQRPTQISYGVEIRYTAGPAIPDCGAKAGPYYSGGAVGRLDFVSVKRPRLVVGALFSDTMFAFQAAAEMSLGLRLYGMPGVDYLGGLRVGAGPFSLRYDYTLNQYESQVSGGLGGNAEWARAVGTVFCEID